MKNISKLKDLKDIIQRSVVPVKYLWFIPGAAKVLTRGLVGVLLAKRFKNMRFEEMDIGKEGPCMVPGHPKRHVLELNPCWSTMRGYLYDHTFQEFLRAVKNKK